MTLRCAADRACACAVLRMRAGRCAFFVVGRLFKCIRDGLRQTCFVVLLFSLLLAQCALWVRSGKSSILLNRDEHFAFLQRTTPLQQPSAPRSGSGRGCTMFPLFYTRPFAKGNHRPTKQTMHRTAHLPRPAPARSAVKRTASVTTGHHLYNVLTTCAARGEERLPPSLHPKALFFFSTEHGALLFLRARRKRRGGCISNKRDVGAFPT